MARSKRQQYQLNKRIEKMLDEKGLVTHAYTQNNLNLLKLYTGYGGLGEEGTEEDNFGTELLYEYYTPDEVIEIMWGLLLKHGFEGGKVLEPSCGTGRFLGLAPQTPKDISFEGYEISKYSAQIAQLLYPNATIKQQYFEQAFLKNRDSVKGKVKAEFDAVIGNPPYGSLKGGSGGRYMQMGESQYTKATRHEDYFITRSLDLLKKGGLLCFIVGTAMGKTFLASPSNKTKEAIAAKAKLLEAYKMPNSLFPYTNVITEIIVLEKT